MLLSEKQVPLVSAFEAVTGHRPSLQSCLRWALKGTEGVRLEIVKLGGRFYTSEPAVRRFLQASTQRFHERAGTASAEVATPRQSEKAAKRAADELAKRLAVKGGRRK